MGTTPETPATPTTQTIRHGGFLIITRQWSQRPNRPERWTATWQSGYATGETEQQAVEFAKARIDRESTRAGEPSAI